MTHPKASFKLNYLLRDLVSKYNHILRYWGLELQNMNLEGECSSAYKKERSGCSFLLSLIQSILAMRQDVANSPRVISYYCCTTNYS